MANTIIKEVYSKEETYNFALELGEKVKAPCLICLDGDLGAGKTVFAKGLAKGLGVEDDIVSPTFVLFNVYEKGRLPFYHFDVYRIEEPEEMYEIGYEDYINNGGVALIEWANIILEDLPKEYIRIEFKYTTKEDERLVDIRYIGNKEKEAKFNVDFGN